MENETKSREEIKNEAPKHWQSLEQWRQDPEFQKMADNEFLSSPFAPEDSQGGWARREFLKLMGASMALTTFGCVRRPAQKIVPYAKRPEEVVNGISNYYTSTLVDGSEAYGLIVKTREGRPFKIEGNPAHPVNQGGLPARAHASLLDLYDPDRFTAPKRNLLNEKKTNRDTVSTTYEEIDKVVASAIKGRKLAVLTGSVVSPTTRQLLKEFSSATGAKHYMFDSVDEGSLREGQKRSYGSSVLPRYNVEKADVILSVGSDFLGTHISPIEFSKQFARRRKPENMNKLICFEAMPSLTGMNADDRYQVKPSEQLTVLMAILTELIEVKRRSRYAADTTVKFVLTKFKSSIELLTIPKEVISSVAETLWQNRGQSLVVAGTTTAANAIDLQIAANFLNSVLGNDGRTVDASQATLNGFGGSYQDLEQLSKEVQSGRVDTLVIWGTNPAYTLPADSSFFDSMRKLKNVIYAGDRNDETGRMSDYLATDSHNFEKWTDSEVQNGVYTIGQPTISPLYKTRAFEDSVIAWAKEAGRAPSSFKGVDSYEYLKNYWKNNVWAKNRGLGIARKSFEDFWYEVLQEGVFDTTEGKRNSNSMARNFRVSALKDIDPANPTQFELCLYQTVALGSGRLANVPWLQELPDPVTKIVWDNYINISIFDAHELHIKEGQVLELTANGQTIALPAHIQPGLKKGVLAVALGYGRVGAGAVADEVGVNAYKLASVSQDQVKYSGASVQIKPTGRFEKLASPQGHHTMEGRQIAIETTLEHFKADPESNIHRHKIFSLWDKHEYKGHKWSMAIDLNACNGCGACVVACQSENNIPVVGKRYVLEGRIMHWIRVDRYFTGQPEDPGMINMPITCQHCDNAPCETVCPVAATMHSDEGLNDMIYNRCVGTRYCANNCPYKVRRFNWFNNVKSIKSPQQMALNPEVTVRDRGVMEKCSFCKPRINEAKELAVREERSLRDGDVKTACQQTCPADAIVFGDINDPNSQVSQMFKKQNSYSLLEELNTVPAMRYQTRIKNTDKLKTDDNGHKGGH